MNMQVNKAVLVNLAISSWDANTLDKRVSKAVADENEVQDLRLCRLRKSLLAKNTVMDKLYAIIRAARTFHYENTHAWMHDGPRILMTANFDAYMRRMRQAKADFETCLLQFWDQYDDIKADSAKVLGKLYNEADYPTAEQLKSRYSFGVAVQPMPASGELLDLGLEPQEAQVLREKLEADMSATFERANRKMWEDLHVRLAKLTDKLTDEKAYVKQETIAGVLDLVELLPRLNITGDKHLEMMAERLRTGLSGLTAESAKHNPDARLRAATEAQTIFSAMESFMNPGKNGAAASPFTRVA